MTEPKTNRTEKFTPVAWRAVINEPLEDDHICDVYDSNNNCVCECFTAGNWGDETGISEAQKEANMYLIAAAPEMYRKLKTVLALCEGNLLRKTRCDILGKEIEELLNKARGEE